MKSVGEVLREEANQYTPWIELKMTELEYWRLRYIEARRAETDLEIAQKGNRELAASLDDLRRSYNSLVERNEELELIIKFRPEDKEQWARKHLETAVKFIEDQNCLCCIRPELILCHRCRVLKQVGGVP